MSTTWGMGGGEILIGVRLWDDRPLDFFHSISPSLRAVGGWKNNEAFAKKRQGLNSFWAPRWDWVKDEAEPVVKQLQSCFALNLPARTVVLAPLRWKGWSYLYRALSDHRISSFTTAAGVTWRLGWVRTVVFHNSLASSAWKIDHSIVISCFGETTKRWGLTHLFTPRSICQPPKWQAVEATSEIQDRGDHTPLPDQPCMLPTDPTPSTLTPPHDLPALPA